MNHKTAPSANSRKTTLPRNAIQWFVITHALLGSIAWKTCDYSVSAATVHVFHFSLLCRAEEFVKLIYLPQAPECLPYHFHILNHSAGKSSTRAINFQKTVYFARFTSPTFSAKQSCVILLNPNPTSNCTSTILEPTFGLHKQQLPGISHAAIAGWCGEITWVSFHYCLQRGRKGQAEITHLSVCWKIRFLYDCQFMCSLIHLKQYVLKIFF